MCFNAMSEKARAKKIYSPITGFKILDVRKGKKKSPYMKFDWEFSKLMVEPLFNKTASYGEVDEGFHCFRDYNNALRVARNAGAGHKVYLVTIPDGSFVYTNETEYCSNQMILEPFAINKLVK